MSKARSCSGSAFALAAVALLVLFAAPAAATPTRAATVSITGFIQPGPGNAATLNLTNGGPDGVLYWRVAPPGTKMFDSANAGNAPCRIVEGQASCGPYNPPVPSGQTFTAIVQSAQGLSAADGPFAVFATSNGTTDDGPFLVAWRKVVKKCKCVKLGVSMKASDAYTAAGQLVPEGDALARMGGLMSWKLKCSAGAGGCAGKITLLPVKGTDIKASLSAPVKFVPKKGKYKGKTLYKPGKPMALSFGCSGLCNKTTTGRFFLKLDSKHDLLPAHRAGKTFVLRFKIKCNGTSTQKIRFVFKANGDLDRAKSTLKK